MFNYNRLPDLNKLREQCHTARRAAIIAQDWPRACSLSYLQGYLKHDDCLDRRKWHIFAPHVFLPFLGYSEEKVLELEERINEAARFRGKLQYTDSEGKTHICEAILDPQTETYYAFLHFGFFKRDAIGSFYSLNHNGEWERDVNAERRYYDSQYDYVNAKIMR